MTESFDQMYTCRCRSSAMNPVGANQPMRGEEPSTRRNVVVTNVSAPCSCAVKAVGYVSGRLSSRAAELLVAPGVRSFDSGTGFGSFGRQPNTITQARDAAMRVMVRQIYVTA